MDQPTSQTDWHREDIKAAIRRRGVTLAELAGCFGVHRSAVSIALQRPYPRLEAMIAKFLGETPQAIWPSRYDTVSGAPLTGPLVRSRATHNSRASAPHRQKRAAA